jgi:hypothetical protein
MVADGLVASELIAWGMIAQGLMAWGLGSGYRLRRPNQSGANAPSENYGFFCF